MTAVRHRVYTALSIALLVTEAVKNQTMVMRTMKTKKNDKSWNAYRAYVKKLAAYFRWKIGHSEYRMDVSYYTGTIPGQDKLDQACVASDSIYLTYHLKFAGRCFDMWKTKNYYELAEVVCHETCHLITAPMKRLALWDAAPSQIREIKECDERQTTRTCNCLMWLHDDDFWLPANVMKLGG